MWWADIGNSFIYSELLEHMVSNDELLGIGSGDQVPPQAVSLFPVRNDTGVPPQSNIVIEFDEPITLGSGRVVLRDAGGAL